jgi:hypothetical protein
LHTRLFVTMKYYSISISIAIHYAFGTIEYDFIILG